MPGIFKTSMHGGLTVYAFPAMVAVARGGRMYLNPVLHGVIRRTKTQNKKHARLFCRLNWNFISCCPEETVEDLLIISCQGSTFELELDDIGKQGLNCLL